MTNLLRYQEMLEVETAKYVSAAVNKDLVQVPGRSSVVIAKHVVFVCHLVGHAHVCFVEIVA